MSSASSTILNNLDKLALLAGGLFAGGALYASIDEVPAIETVGTEEHWRFFPLMYQRAATSQSIFATTAAVAGITYGMNIVVPQNARNLWIFGGSAFVGILVWTVAFMLPTNNLIIADNKRIKSESQSQFDLATQQNYLDKWGKLHLFRTVTSFIGFTAMALGTRRH